MKVQKFKRGNLVKCLVGHVIWKDWKAIDISPNDVGREGIIEYSYAEKYGGDDKDNYSIIWCDTGESIAWKQTNELELLDKGGDHLVKLAKSKRKKVYSK